MTQYVLNTGQASESPRSEVRDDAIAAIAPLLADGEHELPPWPAYTVRTRSHERDLIVDIRTRTTLAGLPCETDRVCVGFVVAPNEESADRLWPSIEAEYHRFTEITGVRGADSLAVDRPRAPFCATIIMLATPDEIAYFIALERCMAWAWMESRRR